MKNIHLSLALSLLATAPATTNAWSFWEVGQKLGDLIGTAKDYASQGINVIPTVGDYLNALANSDHNNIDQANNKNWMTVIQDTTLLSNISMPGTHDTATYSKLAGLTMAAQCQSFDVPTQLNGGVRYLDIRARHVNNMFKTYHGCIPLDIPFEEIMSQVGNFLKDNPTETVLIRHKDESDWIDCNRNYVDTFQWYRTDPSSPIKWVYDQYMWTPTNKPGGPDGIPTMKDVRGKFVILYNFDNALPDTGFGWGSSWLAIEDDWNIGYLNEADVATKWNSATTNMQQAIADTAKDKIFLTHLSAASLYVWPRQLALGTNAFLTMSAIVGLNIRAQTLFENLAQQPMLSNNTAGVVIVDFPGSLVATAVIKQNPDYKTFAQNGGAMAIKQVM